MHHISFDVISSLLEVYIWNRDSAAKNIYQVSNYNISSDKIIIDGLYSSLRYIIKYSYYIKDLINTNFISKHIQILNCELKYVLTLKYNSNDKILTLPSNIFNR